MVDFNKEILLILTLDLCHLPSQFRTKRITHPVLLEHSFVLQDKGMALPYTEDLTTPSSLVYYFVYVCKEVSVNGGKRTHS